MSTFVTNCGMDGAHTIPRILVVDDDHVILRTLSLSLKGAYDIKTAPSVSTAKAVLQNNAIDLIILDLNFEAQTEDGIALMDWMAKQSPGLPIVVYSNDSKTKRVIDATRRNPVNVIVKFEKDTDADLKTAIETGLVQRKLNVAQKTMGFQFLTASPTMQKILDDVNKVAARGMSPSILITGESGTGKEILAKHCAARFQKRMISANMAAIPKEMAESELFGHCRGAFTGAYADKVGLIEQAHNGIFFLDELGDCPSSLQAKLLRVVQSGEIRRVGDNREKKVSVQFLSAT
ncbi:MAG: sigma-54-dependent Fis family transcriptional regulator, partial [Bdellovibrio sp.]|nr:sigma-54-dependent Fis family transcriptional regulator [Bdellovibrio sp.]